MSYNFNWKYFTQEDYNNAIEAVKANPKEQTDEYLGQIQVGELHFDTIFRDYSDHEDGSDMAISFDCYVANEDTGYGYTSDENGNDDMPYDYADGTDLYELDLSYIEFIKRAEQMLTEFIERHITGKSYSLVSKASAPLLEW